MTSTMSNGKLVVYLSRQNKNTLIDITRKLELRSYDSAITYLIRRERERADTIIKTPVDTVETEGSKYSSPIGEQKVTN